MFTIPIYLSVMLVQLARHRNKSAKALGVGLFIAVAHALIIEVLPLSDPIVFYSLMFMLSYTWYLILDYLSLKLSAMISVGLVCFQIVMVFNAVSSDDVVNSMLYRYYPVAIIMVNLSMLWAAIGEKDDLATNRSNAPGNHKGANQGKGTV